MTEFEKQLAAATWLVGRLHEDPALLRSLMGGDRHVNAHKAMSTLEGEAREHGYARTDLDAALARIAIN